MKDTNILIVQTTCTHTITPLVTQKSTQNALHHENARAVVHVPGPSNIMLLTHIRFPTRLRSTASPILSHFHTRSVSGSQLQLQRLDSIPVFFPLTLSLQKCFETFSLYYVKHLMWFESLYLQLPCDLHRNGLRSRVLQGPFTVQKHVFSEGVCSFQCVHHGPGCYSGARLGTGIMKLDVCIMRQGSPRIKTRQQWYFLVMWPHIISETRNLNIPLHCWKYTSWFGKQVKCRTNVLCILAHGQFIGNNELMTSLI